jgi:hypothetical protein
MGEGDDESYLFLGGAKGTAAPMREIEKNDLLSEFKN